MRAQLYYILNLFRPFVNILYTNRLRVLAYHDVPDKEAFNEHIQYLKSHYNLISVEELKLHFLGKTQLPKKPLLITFDDGDISVYENGLPVLQRHEVPSCLFIITSLINTSNDVWIRRVEAGEMSKGKSYSEARKVVKYLKDISNYERIQAMKDYAEVSNRQLNLNQLFSLKENRMYIANHSHTHPMFDRCSELELKEELQQAKNFFNSHNLEGYSVFAYPNGNADELSQAILTESGMEMIFLFDHKINPSSPDPKRISRIKVDADTEMKEFQAKVSGVHPLFLKFKNKIARK